MKLTQHAPWLLTPGETDWDTTPTANAIYNHIGSTTAKHRRAYTSIRSCTEQQ